MKRFLSVLVAGVVAFSLSSCAPPEEKSSDPFDAFCEQIRDFSDRAMSPQQVVAAFPDVNLIAAQNDNPALDDDRRILSGFASDILKITDPESESSTFQSDILSRACRARGITASAEKFDSVKSLLTYYGVNREATPSPTADTNQEIRKQSFDYFRDHPIEVMNLIVANRCTGESTLITNTGLVAAPLVRKYVSESDTYGFFVFDIKSLGKTVESDTIEYYLGSLDDSETFRLRETGDSKLWVSGLGCPWQTGEIAGKVEMTLTELIEAK